MEFVDAEKLESCHHIIEVKSHCRKLFDQDWLVSMVPAPCC